MFGKFSGAVSVAAKERCWNEVAGMVSAVSGIHRTGAELKKKWSCLKSEAKSTASGVRRSQKCTGGGPKAVEELDDQKQRIVSLIGEVCVEGVGGGTDTAACQLQAMSGTLIAIFIWSHGLWCCIIHNYCYCYCRRNK